MCFYIKDNKKYIAEEDIVCYKGIFYQTDNSVESFWTGFTYVFGRVYNMRDGITCIWNSKSKLDTVVSYMTIIYSLFNKILVSKDSIYAGYHAYKVKPDYDFYSVVECIIPKGSTYYMNDDEYVSNKIKIIKYI